MGDFTVKVRFGDHLDVLDEDEVDVDALVAAGEVEVFRFGTKAGLRGFLLGLEAAVRRRMTSRTMIGSSRSCGTGGRHRTAASWAEERE